MTALRHPIWLRLRLKVADQRPIYCSKPVVAVKTAEFETAGLAGDRAGALTPHDGDRRPAAS